MVQKTFYAEVEKTAAKEIFYIYPRQIRKVYSDIMENIKDYLEEMKNISSLMLDLAYSSVFFSSRDIASEVILLYRRIEELEEKLFIQMLSEHGNRKSIISVLEIVESTKRVAQAAKNVSKLVLQEAEVHPIIKEALKESDESITKAVVTANSLLANKTIGDMRLRTEIGINIIAIKRAKKWIFRPRKATKMFKNDMLIGIGPKASCRKLVKLAERK